MNQNHAPKNKTAQEISIEEMNSYPPNITAILIDIYSSATIWARKNNQVVGKKNDLFITLEQLMELFKLKINEK